MSGELKAYLVALQGRGKHWLGLAQVASVDELANQCQISVDQGFEVYIYSLEPSPAGQITAFAKSVVNLRRHYHLFDATERYTDEAHSLIEGFSQHSIEASRKYIQIFQAALAKELEGLDLEQPPGSSIVAPNSCTFHSQPDNTTTGS